MAERVTPKIECVDCTDTYGRFEIEPLEAGFGTTLGNALRRVLLSSLEGAAVTSVRIDQVEHEFSTIPHMKEDTIEFLLNVKDIRLRGFSDRPGKLTLEMAGEGRVSAGDIRVPADYEIVNPELHLATLDSADARLTAEFNVERGKGYVPAGHGDGLPIGEIPVDAIFTPVRRVNYNVESTRVGPVTNYDKLTLSVWTDGTITPVEAVRQSAQVLVQLFGLIADLGRAPLGAPARQPMGALPVSQEQYNMPIEELGLSVRTYNCLKRSNIATVGQILERTEEDLLALRNFGRKSLDELNERLQAFGILPTKSEEAAEEEAPLEPEAKEPEAAASIEEPPAEEAAESEEQAEAGS